MTKTRRGRGEGGVRYRADKGLWVGETRTGGKRTTVYGKTKAECLRKLKAGGKVAAGELATLSVSAYLRRYLDTTAKDGVAIGTLANYEQLYQKHLERAKRLQGITLAKLTTRCIEDLYADWSRAGVGQYARLNSAKLLVAALKHATRTGVIPANPAAGLARPRVGEREMSVLDEVQAKTLVSRAGEFKHGTLFVTALASGLRQGELLALRWSDVDLAAGTLIVRRTVRYVGGAWVVKEPKTEQSKRTVGLPPFAVALLKAHRVTAAKSKRLDAPVFPSPAGGYQYAAVLTTSLARALARLGLPVVRFHDLRHTHATLLISRGCSLKAVSRRLGHANVSLTLRVYAHVMPADEQQIVAQLDSAFNGGT
jgi:integrase